MHADTSSWPTEPELNWTPRQLEVIKLIAKGHTNAQIAEYLDISLAGAKWHVSEILSKLGVESREAIPDYWRSRRGIGSRLRRRFALGIGMPSAKGALGSAGGLVLVGAAAVGVAWQSSGPGPGATASEDIAVDHISAARAALADLASVSHFPGPTSFDPHDTSGFGLELVEQSVFEGQVARRVVFVHPGIRIGDTSYPLTFEAWVDITSGDVLRRGFTPVSATYAELDFPLAIGPFIEVTRVAGEGGGQDILSIAKHEDGEWWFVVQSSGSAAYASLGPVSLEPGRTIQGTGGRPWVLGLANGSVATVHATLEDGSVLEIVPVSPPDNLGFDWNIYFAPTQMRYANTVRAFDGNGSELSLVAAPARPPGP